MPMEMGQPGGGLMDSVYFGNPQADEREQVERLARVVAMAQAGQAKLTRPEISILDQIKKERARHEKARMLWQRQSAMHRAKIESLIDKLEAVRKPKAVTPIAQAAAAPRVVGQSRRKEVSRFKALRAVRHTGARPRFGRVR